MPEPQLSIGELLDLKAVFVHGAVVPSAQQHEIRELRRPALGPVTDVMALRVTQSAAGETAASIAMLQCPAERRRNRAGPDSDLGDPTVGIVAHHDAAGITG